MASIAEGVYWCARDLAGVAVVGNHHFILMVSDPGSFAKLPFPPKDESGVYFCTLAGFKSTAGRLTFMFNEENDVQSVLEKINPETYTSLLTPDLDLEIHKVTPPHGSEDAFANEVAQLAQNYSSNTQAGAPAYTLRDANCSAWVNTLFSIAGVSKTDRERYGEFFGIDWGEEDLIDPKLFSV